MPPQSARVGATEKHFHCTFSDLCFQFLNRHWVSGSGMDCRWINLKVPFRKFSGHMQTNLQGAVELLGLVWGGWEHGGLDGARNTAYLALQLVKKGIILKVTNSFKTYADDGSKLYIPKLRKPKAMPRPFKNAETNVEEVETTIDHNAANIMCFCVVKSRKRVVKKPGPTQGQSFFSCGNGQWRLTANVSSFCGLLCSLLKISGHSIPRKCGF